MIRRAFIILLAALSCSSLASAQFNEAADAPARQLATASNAFTFDLYRQMIQGNNENLAIAPFSAHSSLLMLYMGAKGQSVEDLAQFLHLDSARGVEPSAFDRLRRQLEEVSRADARQLEMATAMWVDSSCRLDSSFQDLMRLSFGSEVNSVSLQDPNRQEQTRALINDWGNRESHGMIPESMSAKDIKYGLRTVITSAVWFKADWALPFPQGDTKPGDFTVMDGSKTSVPMMHLSSDDVRRDSLPAAGLTVRCMETGEYQLLELPYNKGETSMLILLPKERDGLASIEKSLDLVRFDQALAKLKAPAAYEISLPKFKIQSSASLRLTLANMVHWSYPFDFADFSGIWDEPCDGFYDVLYSAAVDVDESGAEAAAITHGQSGALSAVKTFRFVADHPYLFFIRDNTTGLLLFAGRVTLPQLLQ